MTVFLSIFKEKFSLFMGRIFLPGKGVDWLGICVRNIAGEVWTG